VYKRHVAGRWAGDADVAVGGRTTNGLPDNTFASASQTIVDLVYMHYNAIGVGARFFASNNLVVPAAGFRAVGGFDERFQTSEDRDFCARWLESGRRLVHAPDAVVVHAPHLTFLRFCQRHFDYGRGAYRYHRARPQSVAGSVRGELPFHRRLPTLVRPALAGLDTRRAASLTALLAAWQTANALGFVWEALAARE
jgi:GT2 family glycosyltransferase